MDALLTPLLQSPRMIQIAEELQQVIDSERARRAQFYEDISPGDKWEFINGMHSPATLQHILVRDRIGRLLADYVIGRKLGVVLGEKALSSFARNDYEPDVLYFRSEVAAGLQPDQWKFPVPDLVVEVLSQSTKARDRGTKKDDYERHGVTEYWIVDPWTETIEQYLLKEGAYELVVRQSAGSFASRAIASFTMPVRAAFDDEVNRIARRAFL